MEDHKRMGRAAALAVVAVLGLGACSDDSGGRNDGVVVDDSATTTTVDEIHR